MSVILGHVKVEDFAQIMWMATRVFVNVDTLVTIVK